MTGIDPNDPATAGQAGHAHTDYTQFLDANALAGARIGVWSDGVFDPTAVPSVVPILDAAISTIETASGHAVVPAEILPNTAASGDIYTAEFAALLCEFKTDVGSYLTAHTGAGYPKTLQDLIDFDTAHPNLEGPWNDAIFDSAEATNGRDADCAAQRALATPPTQAAINDLLTNNNLDAIIALTNGPAWVTDPVNGDDFSMFVGSSSAAAISGYASITVPAGHVGPLPIGISFFGRAWDEPKLIALAYAFEQATHVRVPPQFLSSTSIAATGRHGSEIRGSGRSGTPDRESRWGIGRLR
jgi:amidase